MKMSRIIFAAAFAAILFSCAKETILETPKVSLTFSVANELSASKAVLNANAVEFQAGDQIGVWDGASMNCFETTAGGAHASFSGTAASAASYILVSPYNENYSVEGSVVTYSIPDIQVATPGSADPNALVSMAKLVGSGEATLYNCVGLIMVVVPDGLTVKEIHLGGGSDSSVGICGSFKFNTNEQTVVYADAGSMRASITLVPQAGQSVIAPGTYYIAVRPWTSYTGLTLAYVNADNQLCKRTTANTVSVARNHILPVGTLNTTNYTPVTGTATLRYYDKDDVNQFTALIKTLANGTTTAATATDNVIKKIVFRAHTLAYKAGGTNIHNGPLSSVPIRAWVDGDTAYVYTEAPIITLHSTSGNLFRNFAALEEVSFNDVNTMNGASFEYMFRDCANLKTVDFGNADFSKVTNFSYMFYVGATSSLEYVNMGNTSTTAATNMQAMFNSAKAIKHLYLGPNFTIGGSVNTTNAFYLTAQNYGSAPLEDKCKLYITSDLWNQLKSNAASNGFNSARFYPQYL